MCEKLDATYFKYHQQQATIGANLISCSFEQFFTLTDKAIVFDKDYKKIPIGILKQNYSVDHYEIPDEYFFTVNDKFDIKYLQNLMFTKVSQFIVDQFAQQNDDIYIIVLMDDNGYVPIVTSEFSQKITGSQLLDEKYSCNKRMFPYISNRLINDQGEFNAYLADEKIKLHLFYSAIKYDNKK